MNTAAAKELKGHFILGQGPVGPLQYRWLIDVVLRTEPFPDEELGHLDYYRNCISGTDLKHTLSFSGQVQIRKMHRWDTVVAGQCREDIQQFLRHAEIPVSNNTGYLLAGRLLNLWEEWHANDLKPGCVHQDALRWQVCPGHYDLLHEETCQNKAGRGPYDFDFGERYRCRMDQLNKPCPTCGYRMGSDWLYRPVPGLIVDEVTKMLEACDYAR